MKAAVFGELTPDGIHQQAKMVIFHATSSSSGTAYCRLRFSLERHSSSRERYSTATIIKLQVIQVVQSIIQLVKAAASSLYSAKQDEVRLALLLVLHLDYL